MVASRGNGGRSSAATVGLVTDAQFTPAHQGRTAEPIPGLSEGLAQTILTPGSAFGYTSSGDKATQAVSRDTNFKNRVLAWVKSFGLDEGVLIPEFSEPQKNVVREGEGENVTETHTIYRMARVSVSDKDADLKAKIEARVAEMANA